MQVMENQAKRDVDREGGLERYWSLTMICYKTSDLFLRTRRENRAHLQNTPIVQPTNPSHRHREWLREICQAAEGAKQTKVLLWCG